ncbi:MAG: aminotransferase class V-fold PLP-dependent enzyme [Pseudomonadales bacterium]|nr:aminotransferase class V-fold PLP-dependent enzyme [Pseudomonadales bacterium]NRA17067.1 aminotransferase class V-fold PLP-dependent enzyme [Oceanospirillaceae bacterium]
MTATSHFDQSDLVANKNLIHFNNAGASLMPKTVLQTQIEHLTLEASIGGYEAANEKSAQIEAVYQSVATLINCQAEEVALVENATIAWMSAFYAIDFQSGDRILTAEAEYASNFLAYLQLKREKGVIIDVIPSNAQGEICCQSLEAMIDDKVKLISITHVPTNGGLVNPAEAVGAIAKKHRILYLLDACQSVGQMPVDVTAIGCDILTATSRKYLRGPRGAGFLYVSNKVVDNLHPAMIDLRAAKWTELDQYQLQPGARRFENWENNYAALLGMGCAIDYALQIGLQQIAERTFELARYSREQLSLLESVQVYDIGSQQCAIVTFASSKIAAAELVKALKSYRINVSCSSPSSTLLDATRRQIPDLVRASVHYFNDKSQVDHLLVALQKILSAEHLQTEQS